jgi:hypothetical protein
MIVLLICIWVLCVLVGWGIGESKDRPLAGILWGATLGIVGCVIAACMRNREELEVIHWQHEELAAKRQNAPPH